MDKPYRKDIGTMYKGIDISEFNGKVDFNTVKNNVDFVIMRCGYGGDYESQDDEEFERNADECERLNIPYGVYLYSYATSSDKALSEAQHTLRLIQGRKISYGVWYDMEDEALPASSEQLANIASAYLEKMEAAGYYCGLYSNLYWLENKLTSPILDKYDKWVAQWNSVCEYTKPYGIWQYTNSGTIEGHYGNFDMNYSYKDYPKLSGGSGGGTPTVMYEAVVTPDIGLNVRSGPDTSYNIITAVPKNTVLKIYKTENGWGYTDKNGWVLLEYTAKAGTGKVYTVTPDIGLNIRKGPGTSYDIITAVPKGTKLTVISETNGWGKLSTGGYVSLEYLA